MDGNSGLPDGGNPPNVTGEGSAGVSSRNSDIFFAAIETTRMPMLLTDPNQPDNPIVFANHAFLNMTGYTAEEIVGRNCRFLQGPDTDREVIDEIRDAVANGQKVSVEILNYRKDGGSFWNALFISPVHNKDGKLVYFFASQLDVSRRRDAEAALRQAQKMEAVGQLTGGIAHDFNNLLQVMIGSLEVLKHRNAFAPDAATLQLVGAMDDAAQRAKTLTQQLLAFSRKQKLEGRIISLNTLVTEMAGLAHRTIGDAITFKYDLADGLRMARIDKTQAEMAILNILINARDAMPDGGTIAIATRNVALDHGDDLLIDNLLPGNYVSLSITDSGTGMPESILKHVMDPFFTTKDEGKGTGLGLSMVYGFAKQSGGSARIESKEGEGTTVTLLFPSTASIEPAQGATPGRATSKGGHEKILVVDDRPDISQMARAMLEDAGYEIHIADGPQRALELMEQHRDFTLLFTDIIMPGGMNGVLLARQAKRNFPALKVLLTTGYADISLEQGEVGGTEFDLISKPYSRSELIRKVRMTIDGPTGVS